MIRNILGTISSKIAIAAMTLLLVIINANYFGAAGVGTIGLIILCISILQLASSFAGGGALIYLSAHYPIKKMAVIYLLWTITVVIAGTFVLHITKMLPVEYTYHVAILSFLLSIYSFSTSILIGREQIKLFNIISLFQIVILLAGVLILFNIFSMHDIGIYFYSLYAAYGISALVSLVVGLKYFDNGKIANYSKVIVEMFRYGLYVFLASFMQLMNYRLSYFFIDQFGSRATLGIYDSGIKLSEGIWLIPKSLALVEYSKISNSTNNDYNVKLSVSFVKVAFVVTLAAVALLCAIPETWFTAVLSKDFNGIKFAIFSIALGIITFSISIILSHYFSGIGKIFHNTISSGIGLIFTVGLNLLFIEKAFQEGLITGLITAGVITSISYISATLYQFIVFVRMNSLSIFKFIPNKSDVELVKTTFNQILKRK